jgi:proline dehydrogenase
MSLFDRLIAGSVRFLPKPVVRRVADRYVAGEELSDAVRVVRSLNERGCRATVDVLGEYVKDEKEAASNAAAYVALLDAIAAEGLDSNVSIKLTAFGLDLSTDLALRNARTVVEHARKHRNFVRIDMENSPYTEPTIEILETLWRQGHRQLGTVIQSYMKRAEADIRRLNALGTRVRLVKGAYKEPKEVAYQKKSEVDAAFVELMGLLLDEGTYPAIATHDPDMIDATKAYARSKNYANDRFEFQMLFGIRRDLQTALVKEGYKVRVYVPFGKQWYPYFMRRLGERPANVAFVVKGLLSDRG